MAVNVLMHGENLKLIFQFKTSNLVLIFTNKISFRNHRREGPKILITNALHLKLCHLVISVRSLFRNALVLEKIKLSQCYCVIGRKRNHIYMHPI